MPAPGTTLVYGNRYNPLNLKFYNTFVKETFINIDYATFCKIIQKTNETFKQTVLEEEAGIKLPENLGHVIVTKYKSKKTPWDWKNTMEHKIKVPHLNLHSFGYIYHIRWFKIGASCANLCIYKLNPYRTFKRALSKRIKEGKKYFTWENTDFWSTTKMERRFERFYKKNKK